MNPNKNLIEPKPYMNLTKNLIEPKLYTVRCILQNRVSDFKHFVSKNIYASLKLGTEWKD
jgi:hypothetical protein